MNILITGGTGSFGQALTEKLLNNNSFQKICIYSRDEHKQEQMRIRFNDHPKLRFFIGDIRDKDRLELATKNQQYIIHAAALKVVPLGEYNPFEVIKTNVLGVQNLVECAIKNNNSGVYPKVVALSTDKACSPINLYGASKLCAEKIFKAANNIMGDSGPKFSIVRYGNVANSNSSIIPLFKSQIAQQKQLTITSDIMSRFWITLDEATDFVLRCMSIMYGVETFVPDMPRFMIKDLAMVMMEHYPPEKQWCEVIGIRPGEKIAEEIITEQELYKCIYSKEYKMYTIDPPIEEQKLSDYTIEMNGKSVKSNSEFVKKLTREELKQKLVEIGAW